MIKFLIDAQLPPALARWLSSQGFDAEHVADRGLESAKDDDIWKDALASGAVLITKDEDFAIRHSLSDKSPRVVWVRLGNASKRDLLNWFHPLLPSIVAAIDRGESLIEIA